MTKKGAAMFPRFDMAYEIPVPVDLISVGKLYVVMRLNKAKPKVLNNLLNPIKTSYI